MLRRGLRSLVPATVATAAVAVAAVAGGAATTPFALVLDGGHVAATIPSPSGLEHAGTFTASAPACATGHIADVRWDAPAIIRRYICDDGSGTFVARITTEEAEHGDSGAGGTWRIVDGSGAYAQLRGKGTFRGVQTGGTILDFASITFRATWSGAVGFDAVAPTLSISQPKVQKITHGTYRVAFALSARDAANAVSYDVVVTAANGEPVAKRSGTAASGRASAPISLQTQGGRTLRVAATASDAVGNATSTVRKIRVPS
jgi:hypothetical protein